MDKFITRLTIILVAAYFIISFVVAEAFAVDILRDSYILLFELCAVLYTFNSGKYHCKYIRWTGLSIFVCDTIAHLDYYFDFISVRWYNLILLSIVAIGVSTSLYKSINHFIKVSKWKRAKRQNQ